MADLVRCRCRHIATLAATCLFLRRRVNWHPFYIASRVSAPARQGISRRFASVRFELPPEFLRRKEDSIMSERSIKLVMTDKIRNVSNICAKLPTFQTAEYLSVHDGFVSCCDAFSPTSEIESRWRSRRFARLANASRKQSFEAYASPWSDTRWRGSIVCSKSWIKHHEVFIAHYMGRHLLALFVMKWGRPAATRATLRLMSYRECFLHPSRTDQT